MSTRGSSVSAIAIIVLLGLVALAALPASLAATPPTRPLALQSSAGDAAVTLSWLAPSNDGGAAITGYKVYRGTIAGGGTLLVTLGDVRTYFDSGLINGRTLYYQVSAMNALGEGARSNEVSATPPQVVGITWIRQFGAVTAANDYANALAVDASGEYVGGETTGTLPGESSAGGADGFLKGYDASGSVIWTRQFGTILDDHALTVAADASARYVAGDTLGTFPGEVSAGGVDAFLRKYAANGTHLWTRQFGSSAFDVALAVAASPTGVYVAGVTTGTLPGQTKNGGDDAFLEKYDADGNLLWTRQFGTPSFEGASGITVDVTGVYVIGNTGGAFPGETNAGFVDAFIRKYDVDGTVLWTREFGTSSRDYVTGVASDASSVYLAGSTPGTFPGQTFAGGYADAFLRKYDADGNAQWTREFGTSGTENEPQGAGFCGGNGRGAVALTTSGVYLAGYTTGTFLGQTNAGGWDVFLRKYDAAGDVTWTREFGTNSRDCSAAIATDASGMYVAGHTDGTFPGEISGGFSDAFLASLAEIPAQPPGPPASLQAAAGDGTVDLTWYQPPSDGRSPVTNYRIYRGTTSGSLTFLSMIGTVLSYADTGRTNGVRYYYAVSAVNAAGEGAQTGEVSATPMGTGTAPTAAQNLQAVAGNAQVTLTWQAPASGGSSAITGYKVYRGTTSGSETLLVSVGVVLTYADTGAANGQIYYYQVSATNSVGEGPRSNEASATPSATDSVRPTIAIASPADNSKLTATSVTVTGTSSDNVGVEKVELSTDGTTWTLATGTTSWSGSVALRAGANVIYARATDTSGNQVTAQVTVTVQTASTGPIPLDLMLLTGALITIIVSLVGYRFVIKVKHKREEPPRTPPASPPVR